MRLQHRAAGDAGDVLDSADGKIDKQNYYQLTALLNAAPGGATRLHARIAAS
jgi:hypothetical protein